MRTKLKCNIYVMYYLYYKHKIIFLSTEKGFHDIQMSQYFPCNLSDQCFKELFTSLNISFLHWKLLHIINICLVSVQSSIKSFFMYSNIICYIYLLSREEQLLSHQAPPHVADRGMLTRYGWYRGNKIPRADQSSICCHAGRHRLVKGQRKKTSITNSLVLQVGGEALGQQPITRKKKFKS